MQRRDLKLDGNVRNDYAHSDARRRVFPRPFRENPRRTVCTVISTVVPLIYIRIFRRRQIPECANLRNLRGAATRGQRFLLRTS